MLGHADGTLASRVLYDTGGNAGGVAAGDFNGDSFVDLAVAGPGEVSVLPGNGTGTFPTHSAYPSGSAGQLAAADVNNDTVLDLVSANAGAASVSVLVGNGDGTFAPSQEFPTGSAPRDVAVGDLNHDGDLDVLTADIGDDMVSVLQGRLDRAGAVPGDEQATVSWVPPSPSSVTEYVVTPFVGYWPLAPQTFDPSSTTHVVTGLTNGTEYRFKVAAKAGMTTIATSRVSNPVTPATVPGAPTIGTATAGDGNATLSWTAPASDGGSTIAGYVVTPYIGGAAQPPQTFMSTATTQTITLLTNGTTYTFTAAAVNAVGTGPMSAESNPVTPATVPSAPTIGSATAGNGQATVS